MHISTAHLVGRLKTTAIQHESLNLGLIIYVDFNLKELIMNRSIDLKAEREYENKKVKTSNVRIEQQKYYWAVNSDLEKYNNDIISVIQGKKVLEVGCSDGKDVCYYSKHCKEIIGVDISDVGIQSAKRKAPINAEFIICDAHKLPFGEQEFDVVIVSGLLHHLNLGGALEQIYRVLKNDGVLCAREPLGINPIYSIYRCLTPKARTKDEKPFDFNDLKILNALFEPQKIKYSGFLTLLSAFTKKNRIRKICQVIDDVLSRTSVKYLYWQFMGIYKKRCNVPLM